MDVEIGQLLDNKYRIVRLLGEGGMGAVYEGENVRIRHRVAIKVLHPNIASDKGARERFEREAQAAGQIGSDHIVEVYDLGELPSGARYMVMEFLAGETLSARIQAQGRMQPPDVAPIMLQFLEGLGAAHAAGIVHRDLKPDNLFLQRTKSGRDFVKIVDFGISKFNTGASGMSMTRTGAVVGTPYYMSPEQVKGSKSIDHRSDIYSAGVVLFESVTGQVPFHADTFPELIFKIALGTPSDPEVMVPGLDPEFAKIIRRSIGREPTDRYQTAAEFAQAITDWMLAANVPIPTMQLSNTGGQGLSMNTPLPSNTPNTPMPGLPALPGNTPIPAVRSGSDAVQAGSLAKSTASGSVLTPGPASPRRSGGMMLAAAGIVFVVLCAVGFGVMRASKGGGPANAAATATSPATPATTTTATTATTATTESAIAAAPASSSASPGAPSGQGATPEEPSAKGGAPTHAGATPATGLAVRHTVAPPSSSSSAASTTVKGRTIRTEL